MDFCELDSLFSVSWMLLHISNGFGDQTMELINLLTHGGIRCSGEVFSLKVINHIILEELMNDQHKKSLACQHWNTYTSLGKILISFWIIDWSPTLITYVRHAYGLTYIGFLCLVAWVCLM